MTEERRSGAVVIRPASVADHAVIGALVRRAFGQADEGELVEGIRQDPALIAEDVAEADGRIVGHILWCRCRVRADEGTHPVALLGEMAVAPETQRQGVGSALVRHGLQRLREAGEPVALVVGHPDYYPRFGFSPELARRWSCTWSGPAFMAARLSGAPLPPPGEVVFPAPYQRFE